MFINNLKDYFIMMKDLGNVIMSENFFSYIFRHLERKNQELCKSTNKIYLNCSEGLEISFFNIDKIERNQVYIRQENLLSVLTLIIQL